MIPKSGNRFSEKIMLQSVLSRRNESGGKDAVDQAERPRSIAERHDHSRDQGGGDGLPQQQRLHRRAGVAAWRNIARFLLALYAPGKHREQHDPPQHEIDRSQKHPRFHQACSNSTSVPKKSFGCRNNTGLPWAPILGSPSPSTRAPSAFI